MAQIPNGYNISPERVPVPGVSISEAASLDELVVYQSRQEQQRQLAEANKEEDVLLAWTAAGIALTALAGMYIRGKLKGKD